MMQRLDVEGTLLKALEDHEDQLDAELEQLNKMTDEDLEDIRRKRLEAMKSSYSAQKQLQANGHGSYTEIHDVKDFFEITKKSKLAVVHFYRPSNWRCEVIDKHLMNLASKKVMCRFVKINAEKAHYLCDKLKIWCLPTLVLVKDQHTKHSIVGFDEFGAVDDFPTSVVEEKLASYGMFGEVDE